MKVSLLLTWIILPSWMTLILLEINHTFRKCTNILKYIYLIYHNNNEKYSTNAAKFLAQCYLFNYMNIPWIRPKSDTIILMEN